MSPRTHETCVCVCVCVCVFASVPQIVVCSLYAVSKLCGFFLHFNDIIRDITHAIRQDAAFVSGLQAAHEEAPPPVGSPASRYRGMRVCVCV